MIDQNASRRKEPRWQVKVAVSVVARTSSSSGGVSFKTVSENMSMSGMFLNYEPGSVIVEMGSLLEAFVYPDSSTSDPSLAIYFICEVVHVSPNGQIGVHIRDIDEEHRIRLGKFLNRIAKENPSTLISK